MSDSALIPIEQKTVVFYDDEITAVLVDADNQPQVYVPVRPICEQLGLAWSSQLQRIRRDPILSEEILGVFVTNTPHDNSKNHFQAIFGELHRRYRVTSYKNIRQSQYQAVLDFLAEWLAAAEDE
jgi:hypothetical protein